MPRLLDALGLVPEPVKRRLRPAVRRGVFALSRVPGADLAKKALRRLVPKAYFWLQRRYAIYAEAAVRAERLRQEMARQRRRPEELSADALASYSRLQAFAGRNR